MRKKYTPKEKEEVLALFVENNYNASQTSEQSGVNHLTIKKWYGELDGEARKALALKQSKLKQIELKLQEEEEGDDNEPIQDIIARITRVGLTRIEALIWEDESPRNIAYTLKVLNEIANGKISPQSVTMIKNNFFPSVEEKIKTLKVNPFE